MWKQKRNIVQSRIPNIATVSTFADGEVFSWGKSARGRLGREDEDTRVPQAVRFAGAGVGPFTCVSLCSSHGTTLLVTKRKFLCLYASHKILFSVIQSARCKFQYWAQHLVLYILPEIISSFYTCI